MTEIERQKLIVEDLLADYEKAVHAAKAWMDSQLAKNKNKRTSERRAAFRCKDGA